MGMLPAAGVHDGKKIFRHHYCTAEWSWFPVQVEPNWNWKFCVFAMCVCGFWIFFLHLRLTKSSEPPIAANELSVVCLPIINCRFVEVPLLSSLKPLGQSPPPPPDSDKLVTENRRLLRMFCLSGLLSCGSAHMAWKQVHGTKEVKGDRWVDQVGTR